jgi:methionine aminopeptidase
MGRRERIELKTPSEIRRIREAGRLVAATLAEVRRMSSV